MREVDKLSYLAEEQAKIQDENSLLYSISPWSLAVKRVPALLLTMSLELMGGVVIDQLHKVIKAYTLIVSFMPAISALSGNLGLQASANTIRGIGTGQITSSSYLRNMGKEIKSGFLSSTIIACIICTIGTVWAYAHPDNSDINITDPEHPFVFGSILFMGTWISMMIACVNGSGIPILARLMNLDPAKIAGSMETAFQDVVGQSFLLGVSYIIFSETENRLHALHL